MVPINDAAWFNGLDSISNPSLLPQGTYQWGQNIVNRGGIIETRQGFAEIDSRLNEAPRGLILAKFNNVPYLLAAIGDYIYKIRLSPLGTLTRINGISFPYSTGKRMVHFELCVQARKTLTNGSTQTVDPPKFIVVIQDGVTTPAYFDGTTAAHITEANVGPTPTPIGDFMKWSGDRLWVAKGSKLYAGDLLNPLQFTEGGVGASGGFFYLPNKVTGMGVTHDFKSLLVMTDNTTSAFQSGLEDRTAWGQTQDFQRVIFPSIGCASHRSIINQYGMTWWQSHDGVVSLDAALQAYQTSRMQVRDQNMARSKEQVKWNNGGGCAGSFGNFLFFSNPSGSQYNVHTWVMDAGVVDTLNQIAPPAWCSNFTGVRPEQWVTGEVKGVQRCFCISNDLVPQGRQATIWEAFIGQRMDVPKVNGTRRPKDIACAFETKFYALDQNQYASLLWIELDLAEIVGNVNLQVYYCGRRTSYKKILDKKLTATVSPDVEQIFDPDSLINVYVPQYRTVRSVTDSHDETDLNTSIQTPYVRNTDREFSVLVTWTGQMAITGLRLALTPKGDYMDGFCEEDELTRRRITAEGSGEILNIPPPDNNFTQAFTSKFLAPLRPRWVEFPSYDSAIANGVFLIARPEFTPAGGGFPSTDYPKNISIDTETVGVSLVYTTDGTAPRLHPLNGTQVDNNHAVASVSLGQTLRCRAYLDTHHSLETSAVYTQAHVEDPTFDPVAGAYPPEDFTPGKAVVVSTDTPGASIRWSLNNADPHFGTLSPSPITIHPYPGNRINAIGQKTGYIDSAIVRARYTQQPKCATPTLDPDQGEYPTFPLTVTIRTATAGAHIRYRINSGDEHVINNTHGNVSVAAGDELRAWAQKTNFIDSDTKTATYSESLPQVQEPSFAPDGGEFNEHYMTNIQARCGTPGAIMSYTIGTLTNPPPDPTPADLPHVIDGDVIHDPGQLYLYLGHKIVKIIAFKPNMTNSRVHEAQFDYDPHGGGQ
jgi:hypothetical protein